MGFVATTAIGNVAGTQVITNADTVAHRDYNRGHACNENSGQRDAKGALMLTADHIEHYRERGYLLLKRAIDPTYVTSLRQAAAQIVEDFDIERNRSVFTTHDRDRNRDQYFMASAERVHCFLEQDALDKTGALCKPRHLAINKIGHAMHDLIPAFTAFCRQSLFGAILRAIGYRAPLLWQTMYIFKQPRIGGEVRWHQDASYLATRPRSVVGFWVALEDAHKENGCLWVQPGGHRSPLREIFEVEPGSPDGVLRALDDTPWPAFEDALAVEAPAGSLVIFHDHMPHFSSRNESAHSRQAFTMHFSERSTRWSSKNWLQRPTLGEFVA